MKLTWPAPERNKGPILEVLQQWLPSEGTVLEVASGSGQHAVWFAAGMPELQWLPTDLEAEHLQSIDAWRADVALPNLLPAQTLDARSAPWPMEARGDVVAVTCCNMIHIAPFEACEGLFAGVGRLLEPGGIFHLYGPFRFEGAFTSDSNEAFDRSLKSRDPSWGVRDTTDLDALAEQHGLVRRATVALPANNHSLIFERGQTS